MVQCPNYAPGFQYKRALFHTFSSLNFNIYRNINFVSISEFGYVQISVPKIGTPLKPRLHQFLMLEFAFRYWLKLLREDLNETTKRVYLLQKQVWQLKAMNLYKILGSNLIRYLTGFWKLSEDSHLSICTSSDNLAFIGSVANCFEHGIRKDNLVPDETSEKDKRP